MFENRFSPVLIASWQQAAFLSSVKLNCREIDSSHIIMGMLEIVTLNKDEFRKKFGIGKEISATVENERIRLGNLLNRYGLTGEDSLSKMHKKFNCGEHRLRETIIHRSDRCKSDFNKSGGVADSRGRRTISVFDFLTVILENRDEPLFSFFINRGVDVKKMSEDLSEISRSDVNSERKEKSLLIDTIGQDMVKLAEEGKINEIFGRESEIRALARALTKRKKNSVILIGDPGVGKTAVVEGLALNLSLGRFGDPVLQGTRLMEIKISDLISGSSHRGDLEKKINKFLSEAKENPEIVVFIDEIHTLLQDGGGVKISDMLKPALQKGDLRCIGATTYYEYKKYFEKDPALKRRFQPVVVKEPTQEETVDILKLSKKTYEKHHGISIPDNVLDELVSLTGRYIPEQHFPDKAFDILDEAASILRINSFSSGIDSQNSLSREHIARAISARRGFPVEVILRNDMERVKGIRSFLKERVIGQDEAVETVSSSIFEVQALGKESDKPLGVFLFAGATGTGKTEMAKSLAEFLFPENTSALITIDMSEYMDENSVLKLIGAPPGYIGFDSGGLLVEKVRKNPYSVLLLDEIEKAHPKIFDIFLQVFDEARLTDSSGREARFNNCYIIMTSNLGVSLSPKRRKIGVLPAADLSLREGDIGRREQYKREILSALENRFRPEFLSRIPYKTLFYELSRRDLQKIVKEIILPKVENRLREKRIKISVDEETINYILDKHDTRYGVRNLEQLVNEIITKKIVKMIVSSEISEGERVMVTVENSEIKVKTG